MSLIEPTGDVRKMEQGSEEADKAVLAISEGFCPEHLKRLERPPPTGFGFPADAGYCSKCHACYKTNTARPPRALWTPGEE